MCQLHKEMTMDRRDFLKTSLGGSLLAGSSIALGSPNMLEWIGNGSAPGYDLVAVKGGEPDARCSTKQ
jgi:hypothetical protein